MRAKLRAIREDLLRRRHLPVPVQGEWLGAVVRGYFSRRSEDLLVYDVAGGDGWGPLCEFLGTPIPDQSFPASNERRAWHGKRRRRLLRLIVSGR